MPTASTKIVENALLFNIGGVSTILESIPIICRFEWKEAEGEYAIHSVWIAESHGKRPSNPSGAWVGDPHFNVINGVLYKECKEITKLLSPAQIDELIELQEEDDERFEAMERAEQALAKSDAPADQG